MPADAPPVPSSAIELSEKNFRAYHFHRCCRAVGSFPADALVRRHAVIIEDVLQVVAEVKDSRRQRQLLTGLLTGVMRGLS